ncbi:hypothetical protein QYF36_024143 [Acer negundo]|nr:hypothetical protein QYF36_024143 [Acer negundo]
MLGRLAALYKDGECKKQRLPLRLKISRYRVSSYTRISYNGNIVFGGDISPQSYSYAELERMTDSFKEEIVRGSSSTVYKGTMMNDNETFIAAKRLESVTYKRTRVL